VPDVSQLDLSDLSFLEDLPQDLATFFSHRLSWLETARPNQLPPPTDDWSTWLLLAGRGFGKTRSGGEFVANEAVLRPNTRVALIGITSTDPARTMVEGESGLLSMVGVEGAGMVRKWNRSTTELFLTNGSLFKGYSSEEPENLRGPQHHLAWADELCAWKNMQMTYDMVKMGLRLGQFPRMVITSTPKPSKLLKSIISDPRTVTVRGSTYENSAHLPESFFDDLRRRYEGTRLGAQELLAQIIENFEDSFLRFEEIQRVETAPECERVVIAVDPAGTHRKDADYTGIVAAGIKEVSNPRTLGYVLADYSLRAQPEAWARRAVLAFHDHAADLIVAEKNYGGEMVQAVIHNVDPNVPVKLVTATKGKAVRAEPVLMLYQQGRIRHVGSFFDLEEQLTSFTPAGYAREGSPDRGDAAVWAFTELMLGGKAYIPPVMPVIVGSRPQSNYQLG
jgi:phage terminase large subunit-like protein